MDATGLVTELLYEDANHPYLVTKAVDPFGRQALFEYGDHSGTQRLMKITDVIGIESAFEYDGEGRVKRMTTPYGGTSFVYGMVQGVISPARFVMAIDPYGNYERVEYNPNSQSTGINFSDPSALLPQGMGVYNMYLDVRNSFYWDKKAWHENPGDYSKAELFHWNHDINSSLTSGVLESSKKPFENRVWYQYPGQGSLTVYVGTSAVPIAIGRVIEDGNGGAATELQKFEYNSLDNPTKIIDPMGRETEIEYASNGMDVRYVRQKNGGNWDVISERQYDTNDPPHLPKTIIDAAGEETEFTYNDRGQITSITNALSETTTFTYEDSPSADDYGKLKSVTRPVSGATTTLTYDGMQRVASVTDSDGYTLAYTYDALNRVTQISYPDSTTREILYKNLDAIGFKDRENRWSWKIYNALRQPVLLFDAAGKRTELDWCLCGKLRSITDANGNKTRWRRDAQGRVFEKIYANGSKLLYAYEPLSGRLASITDEKGQTKELSYYLDGRQKGISYANAVISTPGVSFTYDGVYGHLTGMSDGTGSTSYSYHPAGSLGALKLAEVDGPLSGTTDKIAYSYDALGRELSMAIGTGGGAYTQSQDYDALGRVEEMVNNLGTFGYSYAGHSSRVTGVELPNGSEALYEYFGTSGDLRLKQIKYINSSSAVLAQFDYTYSVEGDIESWAQKTGSLDQTWELGYDLISQLTGNTVKESGNVVEQYDYVYDAGGNRLSTRKDSEVWSASYNVVNEMVSTSAGGKLRVKGHTDEPAKVKVNNVAAKTNADNEYEAVVDVQTGVNTIEVEAEDFSVNANKQTKQWEVTLSSPGTKTFTYDANGNLTGDGTHTYEWDAENRLVAINETATDQRTEVTYDGMNRWVKIVEKNDEGAVISTRQFVWDGLRIAERRDGSNNVVRQYFSQGFYDAGGSEAFLYTKDHLGSVRQLLDESEAVATEYKYDPFGNTTKVSGTVEGDFLYTGHYYHEESKLYFAPFRAYDPRMGRWLSRDPIGERGGINLYGYVGNSPINWIDIFGLKVVKTGVKICKIGIHEYIRWNSGDGTIGFTPVGGGMNVLYGPGQIHSPDPYAQPGEKCRDVMLDDCEYNIEKFKSCMESTPNMKGNMDLTYTILGFVCYDFNKAVIDACKASAKKSSRCCKSK